MCIYHNGQREHDSEKRKTQRMQWVSLSPVYYEQLAIKDIIHIMDR